MAGKVNPHRGAKHDRLDIEALEQMLRSRGWLYYKARLQKIYNGGLTELAGDLSEKESTTKRGTLIGLKMAAQIPDIMIRESRENAKHGKPHDEDES